MLLCCNQGPNQIDADLAFKTTLLPGENSAAFQYAEFLDEGSSEEARKRLFDNSPGREENAKSCYEKLDAINEARKKYVTFIVRKLGISEIHPNLDSKTWKPPFGQVK